MPRMYQPPDYYRPSGTGRIVDLMLRRGDIQAEGAARSGQIWGGAVRGLGDIATSALQERAEQRAKQQEADEKQRRDEAFMGLLQKSGGAPKLEEVVGLFGPEDGMKVAQGLNAFQSIGQKRGEQAMAEIPKLARGLRAVSEPLRAQMYPAIAERIKATGLFPPDAIPDQYDPTRVDEMLSFAESLGAPKEDEAFTLGPDQVRFQGGKEIARGVVKPVQGSAPTEWSTLMAAAGGDANKALQMDQARALGRRPPPPQVPVAPEANDDDVRALLSGATADKIPIKGRSAAIEAAKQSGGIDGTGFVPMNAQQQKKYDDFMDLRAKTVRLDALLQDPDIARRLGPLVGRAVDWTKELGLIGQSTKVKEAFDLFRDLSDSELRKRSGAQISPKEYDRIVGFTVAPTKQPDSNKTNLKRMQESIDRGLKTLGVDTLPAAPVSQQERMSATNPQTGEKLYSDDGGATWHK